MAESGLAAVIRYLRQIICYEAFMAVTATVVVYFARSHTAVFPLLFATGGVLCICLMLYTVSAAIKGDPYRYPYGTGRLENLSAILLSLMITVGALVPFVQAVQSLLAGAPRAVNMGWTSLLLLVSTCGNWLQAHRAQRLRRKNDSPILASNYHSYRTGFVRDGCTCVMIGLCWALKGGNPALMSRLDAFFTIGLTFYSLFVLVPQIWINFRSLADFPISETQQLKIMAILAKYYDRYEMPGLIYTTNRGQTEVLEVELAFPPGLRVGELIELENAMRQDFQNLFPNCVFRIIPQVLPADEKMPMPAPDAGRRP